MSIFDRWRGRPPPAPPPTPPLTLKLQAAPVIQPLPTMPGNPLDAAVTHHWLAFQRSNSAATWEAFVAALEATNRALAADIAKAESTFTHYPAGAEYHP